MFGGRPSQSIEQSEDEREIIWLRHIAIESQGGSAEDIW